MIGTAFKAAFVRSINESDTVVASALMIILSLTEFIVATIAASFCCCCSAWGTSNQQGVILVNGNQPMIFNQQLTQLAMATVQSGMFSNCQISYPTVQYSRSHQYQVMNTNKPNVKNNQTVGGSNLSMTSTQPAFATNPPPYTE